MRVGIVILGCDKNVVDLQYVAGLLEAQNHEVVEAKPDDEDLDVVILSTCSFINEARDESLSEIQKWCAKKQAARFRLVVTGCFPQIAADKLIKTFPAIDAIFGVGKWAEIAEAVEKPKETSQECFCDISEPEEVRTHLLPRKRIRQTVYDFLKIAEGCSHQCSFCTIPSIKGPYRSVPQDILLEEAQWLLTQGVREINLVAQDLTQYGNDLEGDIDLVRLVEALCRLEGRFWIRLLYLYPGSITDGLLDVMRREEKICNYLDIPLQHFDRDILKAMKRPGSELDTVGLVEHIRERLPGVALRSTFIVGFPGETNRHFQHLLDGLKHTRLDHVGAFVFSSERTTEAASLPGTVGKKTATMRYNTLMKTQKKIVKEINKTRLESIQQVLVDDTIIDSEFYLGRGSFQAPEVDGVIGIDSTTPIQPGSFIKVRIATSDAYDLSGVHIDANG